MKLDELVSKYYYDLNENDNYIWQYVSSHRKECEVLTIEQLASKVHVSRTTILRFTQKLGLKGYSEFKYILKDDNKKHKTNDKEIERLFLSYHEYLNRLHDENLDALLEKICKSKRIFAYGTGTVQSHVVLELKRNLLEVGKILYVINPRSEERKFSELLNKDDFVFIISYSGETKIMLEFVKALKLRHVSICALTVGYENTLSKMSDYCYLMDEPSLYNPVGPRHVGLVNYFLFIDLLIARYIEYIERKKLNETR